MADENGSQHSSSRETVTRPRIETLSDLIFGLALSIGAITLLSEKPNNFVGLASSLLGFGWAFLIFLLAGVTDGLDGLMARWLQQKTSLGGYLDPIADKLLLTTSFVVYLADTEPEP